MGSRAYSKGIERKKAPKKLNVLSKYAKETGSPSLQGASGADREELEKKFGLKKRKK